MQESPLEVAQSVCKALLAGRIADAYEQLHPWLAQSDQASLYELLQAAQALPGRKHLILMLQDLLSTYPRTLLGCPVLLYVTPNWLIPDEPAEYPKTPVSLPEAHPLLAQPSESLQFVGWVPPRLVSPLSMHACPPRVNAPWGTTTLAIALFRSCEPVARDECPQAPAGWWGELFSEQIKENCISLSAQRMLPYPQAIEAGRCMLAVRNDEPSPHDLFFLRPDEKALCARDALLFQPG